MYSLHSIASPWGLGSKERPRNGTGTVFCPREIGARASRGNSLPLKPSETLATQAITCTVHVIFFHSLPSRVGCSFQSKLFSIFKLLCLVFVRYYLSSHTALENCVLFVIALRSSSENFFADTRFDLLTQAINLSRLSWCSVWTAREN